MAWTTSRQSRSVITIHFPIERRADWHQYVLLTSDRHWDNPKSDWEMQKRHLDEASSINAPVIDAGDFFCAMQGKYDKRSNKSSLRPEHMEGDYLDLLVKTAADFFEPYASHFALIASGNHEDAIRQRHETDLIDRLVGVLNDRTGSNISHGGFGGFVRFKFDGDGNDSFRQTVIMHYDHGYGGGGPVTLDTIQSNRRAQYLPDAHIVLSGHVHESWSLEKVRLRLGSTGKWYHDVQLHVKCPTYKEEYGDGYDGWHARRGAPPKPIGAYWLKFSWNHKMKRVQYDVERAR